MKIFSIIIFGLTGFLILLFNFAFAAECAITEARWDKEEDIFVGQRRTLVILGDNCDRFTVTAIVYGNKGGDPTSDKIIFQSAGKFSGNQALLAHDFTKADFEKAGSLGNSISLYFKAAAGMSEKFSTGGVTFRLTDLKYSCVGEDSYYYCSEAGKSDCSDVAACKGRECVQIDSSLCKQPFGTKGARTETQTYTRTEEFGPPFGNKDFKATLDSILDWLVRVGVPIAIIMIIGSGIVMLAAGDKPDLFNKAKNSLLYTIIGLFILLVGRGFVTLIESILNLAR